MDPRKVALVVESYEELRPIPRSLGASFYERLFELDPSLRALFKGNLDNQASMFVSALGLAVLGLRDEGHMPANVQDLGARHKAYGVPPGSYATFREAFLWALGQSLGEKFTPELRDAWSGAFEDLSRVMRQASGV